MSSEMTLQSVVKSDDHIWDYRGDFTLRVATRKRKIRTQIFIKSINVSNENIKISNLLMTGNRLTLQDQEEDLIHISFDLSFTDENNQKGSDLTEKYIDRLLKAGIRLNSVHYSFYGHSNSQLQSRSCFLRKEQRPNANFNTIKNFRNFHKINSVAKRAKRIGLLFSSADLMIDFDQKKCKLIEDVEKNQEIFTDGCGSIDRRFAKAIANRIRIPMTKQLNDSRHIISAPSVFQIRFMGYKGVLVVTPDEEMRRIVELNTPLFKIVMLKIWDYFKSYILQSRLQSNPSILFRKSMKKFDNCRDETKFCVLDHSKPLTYGKLNGELITLLSTLKISTQIFADRLKYHLELVQNCQTDVKSAKELAILKNNFALAREFNNLKEYHRMNPQLAARTRKLQNEEKASFFDKEDQNKIKVQIIICDSRILFGVCDFSGKLKEGQCFVQYSELNEDKANGKMWIKKKVLTGKIVVGRNPCLHPGDIQIFEAVEKQAVPELSHLCDCIVFSVHGEKPAASLMSGGDLDGDRFFVCWDKQLIPNRTCQPVDYSKLQPTLRRNDNIIQNDMIHYFSHYNNFSLGQLKNLYLEWARSSPLLAECHQCIQINALFSKCVDGERVKIPENLRRPPPPNPNKPFVLDVLKQQIEAALSVNENEDEDKESDVEDEEDVVEEEEVHSNFFLSCNFLFSIAKKIFVSLILCLAMLVSCCSLYEIAQSSFEIIIEHKKIIGNFVIGLLVLYCFHKQRSNRRNRRHLRSAHTNDDLENLIFIIIFVMIGLELKVLLSQDSAAVY